MKSTPVSRPYEAFEVELCISNCSFSRFEELNILRDRENNRRWRFNSDLSALCKRELWSGRCEPTFYTPSDAVECEASLNTSLCLRRLI